MHYVKLPNKHIAEKQPPCNQSELIEPLGTHVGFEAMAVRELREHRYCGDMYPEGGWPGVNEALAQYAKEKRNRKRT